MNSWFAVVITKQTERNTKTGKMYPLHTPNTTTTWLADTIHKNNIWPLANVSRCTSFFFCSQGEELKSYLNGRLRFVEWCPRFQINSFSEYFFQSQRWWELPSLMCKLNKNARFLLGREVALRRSVATLLTTFPFRYPALFVRWAAAGAATAATATARAAPASFRFRFFFYLLHHLGFLFLFQGKFSFSLFLFL